MDNSIVFKFPNGLMNTTFKDSDFGIAECSFAKELSYGLITIGAMFLALFF